MRFLPALLGIDANGLAAVAYPWLAVLGVPWYLAIALSLGIYFFGGWLVQFFPYWPLAAFALSLLSPLLVLVCLPRPVHLVFPRLVSSRLTAFFDHHRKPGCDP